ncbi:MAG TPA: AGE family epimerase/isomerase, partial [Acidobacteriaceae bacterium]
MMARTARLLVACCWLGATTWTSGAQAPDAVNYLPAGPSAYLHYAGRTEGMLHADVLDVWFPRSIDRVHGGFRSNFTRDWQSAKSDGKFSVFEGRMTWVAAEVAMRRPEMRAEYLPYVRQGVEFLSNVMWDKQYGGFYWGLNDEGKVTAAFTDNKQLYGISFCIYGLAAAYQADHDPKALALAQEAFRWTEKHAHDDANLGYFESLRRDGTP